MNLLLHKLEDMRGATSALNTIGAFEKGYTNPLLKDFPAKKLLKMAYSTTNYYSIQFSKTWVFRFLMNQSAHFNDRTLYWAQALLSNHVNERTLYWAHAVLSAHFMERTLHWGHALLIAQFTNCTLKWAHALLIAGFTERTLYWDHSFVSARFCDLTLYWAPAFKCARFYERML